MSVKAEQKHADTYTNPVYPHSFPDPFVLTYGGRYFAYATGHAKDGNVFDVLTSTDLVNWNYVGSAMRPLDDPAPFYWAPEVVFGGGKFYLYYSVGNETLMHLRVAVSDRPDGGFVDAGVRLTEEDFAIDAHVFIDDDGEPYLFYATDFLAHSHIGTGTVVDRMLDWLTIEGKPRPVTRAKYDWQVYDPQRKEKGGVRWHTVEGPAVLKYKGRYYEMYSGGNWQNTSYGVSFAVTDNIHRDEEWIQYSDGENVLPLLRTVPGKIVGPGHNSIVRGPNGRELYCVYHRWTDAGRVMAIDRMDFAGGRMFITGATDTPQPAPYQSTSSGFDEGWTREGASRSRRVPANFLAGFATETSIDGVKDGIRLTGGSTVSEIILTEGDAERRQWIQVEVDGRWVHVVADGWHTLAKRWLDAPVEEISLFSDNETTIFSDFRLTVGFQDLFDRGLDSLSESDWSVSGGAADLSNKQELRVMPSGGSVSLWRQIAYKDIEVVVNMRSANAEGEVGLTLLDRDGHRQFSLVCADALVVETSMNTDRQALPAGWKIDDMHQYRVMVRAGRGLVYLEDNLMAEFRVSDTVFKPVIFAHRAAIVIDMVRVTAI